MSNYIVKAKKTYLLSSLGASATTVKLKFLQTPDGDNIAMSSFGEFGVIVVKQGDRIEMIKFDDISFNADDEATLDIATNGRDLSPITPYTGGSTGKSFQAGAEVIVSNDPYTMSFFANLKNENTWEEQQTFNEAPRSLSDAVSTDELVRLSQLQSAVLGLLNNAPIVVGGIAGETLSEDQLVYLKNSDGRWWKCDADTASTVENVILGMTRGAGVTGNDITNGITIIGEHDMTGLTANIPYFASNTAGEISSSAGTTEVIIGFAKSTTKLVFMPRFSQQITENIQDALEGNNTDVAVGSGNKMVTQTGLIHNAEKYAVDNSASSTAYTVALSPAPTSLTAGMVVYAKIVNANTTTTPTLNVNGLGAKTIEKLNNVALAVGDIGANSLNTFMYDATNDKWILCSPIANVINLSDVYKNVPNTVVDQVSYRTIQYPILVAGPDASSNYFFCGWADSNITPGSGALVGIGAYEFPCSSDQFLYTNLPPLLRSQSEFRFSDIGANEVKIKFELIPSTVNSGERFCFGLVNNGGDIYATRSYVSGSINHNIRFVLEENGGVDKLWAVNSNASNYNATDITGSLNLTQVKTLELVITSTSIKYYVDGTLVATHTTYLPTSTGGVYLAYGFEYNGTGGSRRIYPAIVSLPLS